MSMLEEFEECLGKEDADISIRAYWLINGDKEAEVAIGDGKMDEQVWDILHHAAEQIAGLLKRWVEEQP